ncbi:MAG: hypothetical protein M1839_001544 [Geoglossum umbratile]|nr:MAG: hypothetical protein M1839_001544 [Geoglossum umbratile]
MADWSLEHSSRARDPLSGVRLLSTTANRPLHPLHPPRTTSPYHRTFSTTPLLHGKRPPKQFQQEEPPKAKAADDPFDFSALESSIQKTLEKLKDELTNLRAGGRLNPTAIEALRVKLGKGAEGETVRLGDIAQVVPRGGRGLVVQVLDPEHLKPTLSTLLSANLNLTPTPLPQDPTHLLLPIPPPTRDSRLQTAAQAAKHGELASNAIRNVRAVTHKRLRALGLAKTVRMDDVKKAEKVMERVVEKGGEEVKRLVEGARKAVLEG